MRYPFTRAFLPMSAFCFIIALLQGCGKDNPGLTPPPDDRYTGYFKITAPSSSGTESLDIDSVSEIVWTTGSATTAQYVDIHLYLGDSLVSRIAANHRAAAGRYGPLSFGKGLIGSGARYRIKISGVTPDTAQQDFGPYFSITSKYTGSIAFTSPKAGAVFALDSALSLSWSHSGEVGASLFAELYKAGSMASPIAEGLPDSGTYTWPLKSTALGSGSDYRIKITSYQDPSVFSFSPAFQITSRFSGSIAVASPKAGDVFAAGKAPSLPISWSIAGSPGTEFALYLYRDTALVRLIADRMDASRSPYSWSGFADMEASESYRIKVVSQSDPSLSAYSGTFAIQGRPGDAFEPDGNRLTAKPIQAGSPQARTLTRNDTDWVRLDSEPGKAYRAVIKSTVTTNAFLCDSNGNPLGAVHRANDLSIPIDPAYAGRYYLLFVHGSSESEYTINLLEFDTGPLRVPPEFISPDSASNWVAGSRYNIKWVPDTVLYGSLSNWTGFSLYRDSSLAQDIARESNSGSIRWSIPEALPTSDRYRIRIANYNNPLVYSYGPYFAIKGMEPDAYEPDDSRSQAISMADSTTLRRNLTYLDTDWVQIDAQPGRHHLASIVSTTLLAASGFDTDGRNFSNTGRQLGHQVRFQPKTAGKLFLRLADTGSAMDLGRKYSLFLRSFDSSKSDFPLDFGFDTAAHFKGTAKINWTADTGYYGNRMKARLYLDTSEVRIKGSGYPYIVANSGSYSWTVPAGLISSSRYRLRFQSYDVPGISTYSPYFHIDGMDPDGFEPDSAMSLAKAIAADGSIHYRNLTYSDTDWIAFNAVAGKQYLVSFNLMPQLSFNLVDSGGKAGAPKSGTLLFVAGDSKPHYLRAQANTINDVGAYSVAVYSGDTAQGFPVKFSAPDIDTAWSAGSTHTLMWTPDGALFGSAVALSVWQGSKEVRKITPANQSVPNTGSYSWAIPADLPPGSQYQVRMESTTLITRVFGYSRPFAIGSAP